MVSGGLWARSESGVAPGYAKGGFAPYGVALETIPWVDGAVNLPAGDYALAMGTDCQSSFYGYPSGGGNCGMGWGENGSASETFRFKMFTGPWGYAKCLVWQNGLPDSLCVMPRDNPTDIAPHMIDFAIF
jgi:hypothetical protein